METFSLGFNITECMSLEIGNRPEWEIDKRLKRLLGENVRVRAQAFCPPKWNGEPEKVIQASSLVLPDNTAVQKDELYFEGNLLAYRREVALVFVELGRLTLQGETANGRVLYRGRPAVILQAPAAVQLHADHFVEKIPKDFQFYWNHLILSGRQFELPLDL
jgi:hypothetical protein